MDKLKSFRGTDFSSRYDSRQVSGHKDAVSLFERYAKGGDHPKLKEWADKMLPTLRHDLEMAQDLAAGKTVGKHQKAWALLAQPAWHESRGNAAPARTLEH